VRKKNAMKQFIEKYQEQVTGVLTGFDRLVFRGSLRRLNYGMWSPELEAFPAIGMEQYLSQNSILMKHFGDHTKQVSERISCRCRFCGLQRRTRKRWRDKWLPGET
jgi:hypothetical protein